MRPAARALVDNDNIIGLEYQNKVVPLKGRRLILNKLVKNPWRYLT